MAQIRVEKEASITLNTSSKNDVDSRVPILPLPLSAVLGGTILVVESVTSMGKALSKPRNNPTMTSKPDTSRQAS